eukprot:NODE_10018_length_1382_cov_9.969721.p1 GENE.NODE_10018_length_1382_cov_9.969721~~NODE_10018_length_1382_cov_9.969721.p1  ORF type:complete len:439 (-),score=112.01 NODE_10018_length_1382_cov_9.969721:66-1247(-)
MSGGAAALSAAAALPEGWAAWDAAAAHADGGMAAALPCGEATCYVLGGSHVSRRSAEAVCLAIGGLRPSAVCLELCQERVSILQSDEERPVAYVLPPLGSLDFCARGLEFLDPLFWVGGLEQLMVEALLNARSGIEQSAAAAAATAVGANIYVVDRPQSITNARTLAAVARPAVIWRALCAMHEATAWRGIQERIAELEFALLRASSAADYEHASALARGWHEMHMASSAERMPRLGAAGVPILEERDFLLSHNLFHATCDVPRGGCTVGVLGAAHIPGVSRHFKTFSAHGCSHARCGLQSDVAALHAVPYAPLLTAAAVVTIAPIGARVALLRYVRRSRGAAAAVRLRWGMAWCVLGAAGFGAYRAQRQYNVVRGLQIWRRGVSTSVAAGST